jgi:hypothetical protein
MKLKIKDRIILLGILPVEGNILIIRKSEELKVKLSPTESEVRKFGIKQDEKGITWNDPKYEVEIEIGEIMTEEIKKILKKKDEENKITADLISLWDKFVEPKEVEKK